MKTRQTLQLGLAGLGFVLALPLQAAPHAGGEFLRGDAHEKFSALEYRESRVLVARNEDGDSGSAPRRDPRDEQRAKDSKKNQTRDAERSSEPYGYGYERRQQHPAPRDDHNHDRR